MRKILLLLFLMFPGAVALAQPKNYTPVEHPDEIKQQLSAKAAAVKTIRSSFTQEKNLSVLSEKMVSHGRFTFSQTNKVRMEYTDPFNYLMIINGDKVTIRDGQKTNSFSARSNKMFTLINRLMLDCVRGTAFSNKDFKSELFQYKSRYLLVLTPVKKELREFFERISVYIDETDGTVIMLDLVEPSGDNTLITFNDKKLNEAVPDSEFVVR